MLKLFLLLFLIILLRNINKEGMENSNSVSDIVSSSGEDSASGTGEENSSDVSSDVVATIVTKKGLTDKQKKLKLEKEKEKLRLQKEKEKEKLRLEKEKNKSSVKAVSIDNKKSDNIVESNATINILSGVGIGTTLGLLIGFGYHFSKQ
tara:strand:+ start:351 stop:797 length:447 start_codon:yes stop_codon:yes gene_type:complete